MSVGLAHKKESAQIIIFAPQIADDHARGYAGHAHQSGETGCVMFAESNPTTKEKFVQIVLPVFAWRERITESLHPKKLQRVVDRSTRTRILGDPGLR